MTGVIIGVIAYLLIVIVGIGAYIATKAKKVEAEGGASFLLSNRDLPVSVLAVTMALTVLGAAHVLGGFEMTYMMGATTIWFSLAHVVLLTVACLATGRWVRRLGVTTIPQLMGMLHSEGSRLIVSCVMAGVIFGILTLETQGIGILFATLTGWSIQKGAVVGGVLGILYVILAGMKEIGWVNLINTVVMYIGLIIATIYISFHLPGEGWATVSEYYTSQGQGEMLKIFASPQLLLSFALPNIIAVTFCQGISQMLMQPCMSAKNEDVVKKSLWIAAPVNGMFGVLVVCLGLAAKSIAEFNAAGAKLAGPTMLVEMLPGWLVAWVLASFIAAVLSTFAMTAMTPATIFSKDIYENLFNSEAEDKTITRVTRIAIVIIAVIAMCIAAYLPPIIGAINWLFAWLVPVFWLVVFGLFWKRSGKAAIATLIVSWVLNLLWSFSSLPAALNMQGVPNAYVTLATGLVLGAIIFSVMECEPGYFKSQEYLQQKQRLTL